jgi:hypothetical protein
VITETKTIPEVLVLFWTDVTVTEEDFIACICQNNLRCYTRNKLFGYSQNYQMKKHVKENK